MHEWRYSAICSRSEQVNDEAVAEGPQVRRVPRNAVAAACPVPVRYDHEHGHERLHRWREPWRLRLLQRPGGRGRVERGTDGVADGRERGRFADVERQ